MNERLTRCCQPCICTKLAQGCVMFFSAMLPASWERQEFSDFILLISLFLTQTVLTYQVCDSPSWILRPPLSGLVEPGSHSRLWDQLHHCAGMLSCLNTIVITDNPAVPAAKGSVWGMMRSIWIWLNYSTLSNMQFMFRRCVLTRITFKS